MEHPPARALAVVPIARCPPDQTAFNNRWENSLIVLGIILLVIGFVAGIAILWTIGVILVVVGAIFALLGFAGREIGGRKHWY
jgi:membrane-bound ClpP family serine protease